jgi:integrase
MVAKRIDRLSPRRVATERRPGYYADGGGLYLQVSPLGTKSWIFRFTLNGRAREMGLGSETTFSLAEARAKARTCRQQIADGIDPIDARKALRAHGRLEAAKSLTFKECAKAYIEAHRAGWSNAKHASQWVTTLETYVEPVFGALPVQAIDTDLVMRALEPVWLTKSETATRLRGRIESILDWAKVRGLRAGDNPARWRGHLDMLLVRPSKVKVIEHHPALPYTDMPALLADLAEQKGIGAKALEFAILTAARTGEVIGATWAEFELDAKLWTIPPARMKAKREHRVPLSPPALRILESMQPLRRKGGFVFPGARLGMPLSSMAMRYTLSSMGRNDITVHGFRSSFRVWAAESTNYPRELAEAALAHVNADKVEAAYLHSDLFEKRRALMNAWATYCGTTKASVKVLQAQGSAVQGRGVAGSRRRAQVPGGHTEDRYRPRARGVQRHSGDQRTGAGGLR